MALRYILLSCLFALAASQKEWLIFNVPSLDRPAEIGELRHEVSLQRTGESTHYCAGSIVTSDYILTVAKCCTGKATDIIVRAGRRGVQKEIFEHSINATRYVLQYPNIHDKGLCLLQLRNSFVKSDNVNVIELAKFNSMDVGVTTSGWALSTEPGSPLRTVKVLTLETCTADPFEFCTVQPTQNPVCLNNLGSSVVMNFVDDKGYKTPMIMGLSNGYDSPCKESLALSRCTSVFSSIPWIRSIINS